MSQRLLIIASALLLAGSLHAEPKAVATLVSKPAGHSFSRPVEQPQTLEFEVSYDGRKLGTHRYTLTPEADALRVTSTTRLRYRLAFVPLFRYDHEASELWRDGCLVSLDATTNDDGTRYDVSARQDDGMLTLERRKPQADSEDVPADCPASFAYWDRTRLERAALLNAQTGKLEGIEFQAEGEDEINGIATRRYRLTTGAGAELMLWYAADDDRWLRLETRRDKGTLTYERMSASS
ncbi:MAG: DUF6134 family protein [Pseudomonadota bacterium]